MGYSPPGHKELEITEHAHKHVDQGILLSGVLNGKEIQKRGYVYAAAAI